jgi:DNA (cytosine-5)-methyltransferase 1
MMHTPPGCSARNNPVYFPKNKEGKLVGGSIQAYTRMEWDQPAPTVTTYNHTISSFRNVHPGYLIEETWLYSDPRVLTIFELMRVTSLPDDWNIPDWAEELLIRQVIGEGIPPLAVKKVVAELHLLEKQHD